MRPITVSVGPLAATSNLSGGAGSTSVTGGQLPLGGSAPTGGAGTASYAGNCTIVGNVLTVVSTNTGAFQAGARLSGGGAAGVGLQPNTTVLGPGPTPGTWIIYPAVVGPYTAVNTRANRVMTLDAPRQLVITNTEAAGNSFTIWGTDAAGNPISETLATNGGNLTTQQSFLTVTQWAVALPMVGTALLSTAATASSALVMFDPYATPASITKQATLTGAATFSVQVSNDDPNAPGGPPPGQMTWSNDPDATFVGATTNVEGSWAFVPLMARVLLTAGAGAVRLTFVQAGSP
jgi:hypothetical protein